MRFTSIAAPATRGRIFLAATLLWTWIFWFAISVFGLDLQHPLGMLLYGIGGIGPTVVAMGLILLERNSLKNQEFWPRLLSPNRVQLKWWIVLLSLPPLLNGLAVLSTSLFYGGHIDLLPLNGSFTLNGFAVLLALKLILGPIPEEIGWRGYGIDWLQIQIGTLRASVEVWIAWLLWHAPLYFIHGTYQNQNGLLSGQFLVFAISLLAESVLFSWIYNNTNRSILAAIMFHFSINLTGDLLRLSPRADLIRTAWVFLAAALVMVIGHSAASNNGNSSVRRPTA